MSNFEAIESVGHPSAVFEAAGRSYDVDSILRATDFRGELLPFWRHWRQAIQNASVASEHEDDADEAVLENLANEYRYRRDLVTAEECERWLAARGVEPEEFMAHFVRCHSAERSAPEAVVNEKEEAVGAKELGRLFRIDWVLSDDFDRAARQLAWRVALDCEDRATHAANKGVTRLASLSLSASSADARNQIVRTDPQELMELQRLESAFQACSQQLLTAEKRQHCLGSLRLPLTLIGLEILEVDNLGAAREAFLCVKEDGTSLAKVAVESGYTLRKVDTLLEELPQPWQWPVLSTPVGGVLPPFASAAGAEVCVLEAKREPTLEDPRVRKRVDAMILRQHFSFLESRHVHWRMNILDSARLHVLKRFCGALTSSGSSRKSVMIGCETCSRRSGMTLAKPSSVRVTNRTLFMCWCQDGRGFC